MTKPSFHQTVAQKIIEQLKTNTAPWQRPWSPGHPHRLLPMNPTTNKRYRGMNAIQLIAANRQDQRWLTYQQARGLGAQVRKGEKGTPIQYWLFTEDIILTDQANQPLLDVQGQPLKQTIKLERPRLFFATVFNAEQVDGLPAFIPPLPTWSPLERAEGLLAASQALIHHSESNGAYYRPTTDSIHLPNQAQFSSASHYYATALHELGHWSGHSSRLQRDLSHPFGSMGYAKEELRAEIASMLMGDELGIGHDPSQHTAYIASWITLLHDDPLELCRAAADAETIHHYLLGLEQTHRLAQTVPDEPLSAAEATQTHAKKPAPTLLAEREVVQWSDSSRITEQPTPSEKKIAPTTTVKPTDEQDMTPVTHDKPSASSTIMMAREKTWLAIPYIERNIAKQHAGRLADGRLAIGWDNARRCWFAHPGADLSALQPWLIDSTRVPQPSALTPQHEFAELLIGIGAVVTPPHPIMDGQTHRITVAGDKPGEHAGFYVGHIDGHPAGYVKNNRTGVETRWCSKGYVLTPEQKAASHAQTQQTIDKRTQAHAHAQEQTAQRLRQQCHQDYQPITATLTPYLRKKGITTPVGIFTNREATTTYIPGIDHQGNIWTVQRIDADGTKRFTKDSRKEGCFHAMGGFDALATAPALVISEGYATAYTVSQALGYATVAAFDAGNLKAVALALKETFPDKPVVILGDDDHHLEQTAGGNIGKTKALAAAQVVNGRAFFPIFAPGEQASAPKQFTDFNDLAMNSVLGAEGVKRQINPVIEEVVKQHRLACVPIRLAPNARTQHC